MFEKITKTLSGLAFIKYINSLIDYVNTSDIDATRIKGQLDISNIPPAGLDNVIKVDTVTDMLALTVDDVQNGDTVMIIGVTPPVQYQVVDDTKLGTMDAFQEYAAGTATKALADINGNNIHTTYGKLAGNNTWTGNNYWNGSAIFNANLNIRGSATTPGDTSVYLWLGLKPEGSEQVPCIARNKTGELIMRAADYRHCFLQSGIQTSFASVYNSDGTVEFSSLNNTPWGKYTNANGLELTVHKTPTVNNDVPNKKYVDDSVASAIADLRSSNNMWTGTNTYNRNIYITNGSSAGSSGTLYLGVKPTNETVQARIGTDKLGGLFYHASTNQPHVFRVGTNNNVFIIRDDNTKVTFSSNNNPFATVTHDGVAKWLGNANTATKLQTARTINGVAFDGTANITIADSTKLPIAGGTMTGDLTLKGNPTADLMAATKKYVDDSIANGDVNSAKYLNITNFIPSNSDFNDYKTPGEYQVQSNTEANTIANLPTSYNDATPRGGVLSVLIGFNAPRTSLVQIYRTYGSSYVASRTYQRCFYHENSSWTAWREIACTDEVGLLNQANTFTALNTFRANIKVSNGSAAGSSGNINFGIPPTNETVQAKIGTDKLGGLFYHASTNQPHVFRVGTNNNVFIIRDDNTKVTFSSNNNPFATVTHDGVAKWLGNANTATKLQTARTINGVAFDGTQDITINCDAGSGSNLTTYTSLEQIGITPGEETFASIHSALPINSVLEYYASEAQNFADIYPASYGNFIATRLTGDITIFHFTGTNQTMYVTHYHVTNNTNPSWTQIAKQSDLTNLSNSVVKSVNGIKPTNGNVTIDIPKPVIASEAEAEAGTNNTKFMSPLRVKQAISALVGDSSWTISKGTNGWARENSTGLTVQWGYLNRSNISGTFTFPRTFTTCYYSNVMCSSNLVPYIIARSNTSITFNTNNGYNDDIQNWGNCYIFAIGVS